jgi:hypothetical protein
MLDENTGTLAADSSGNGLDGTLIGPVTWTPGEFGSAALFDPLVFFPGVPPPPEYIRVAHDPLLDFNSGFSLSFWINAAPNQQGVNGEGVATIIDKSHGGPDFTGWAVQASPGTGAALSVAVGTGGAFPEAPIPGVLDSTWHHVAITVDLDPHLRIRGYVDGAPVTDFSDQGVLALAPNSRDLLFGAWYGGGAGPQRQFLGKLDEIRLYAGVLGPCEVAALADPAEFTDCNGNGADDECEIAICPPGDPDCADCNGNGVLDACDIADCPPGDPACGDCNGSGVPDGCDVDPSDPDGDESVSADCNNNGIPDECIGLVDGIDPRSEHRVFVTSTQYNGNFGGVEGADAICQAQADSAGLLLPYRAIMSDSGAHVSDRISLNGGAIRITDAIGSSLTVKSDGNLWNGGPYSGLSTSTRTAFSRVEKRGREALQLARLH